MKKLPIILTVSVALLVLSAVLISAGLGLFNSDVSISTDKTTYDAGEEIHVTVEAKDGYYAGIALTRGDD